MIEVLQICRARGGHGGIEIAGEPRSRTGLAPSPDCDVRCQNQRRVHPPCRLGQPQAKADVTLDPVCLSHGCRNIQNTTGERLSRGDDMDMITLGVLTAPHEPRHLLGRETAGCQDQARHHQPEIVGKFFPDRHGEGHLHETFAMGSLEAPKHFTCMSPSPEGQRPREDLSIFGQVRQKWPGLVRKGRVSPHTAFRSMMERKAVLVSRPMSATS